MKLLDRYIIRQYLTNIVALLVILFCFVVMIDVSLNLSRYWSTAITNLRPENPLDDSTVRRVLVTILGVVDIWWPRLLSLFNFLLGLVLVGAMGFTCTQLVRNRELVAVLSSGQSLFRVARPFIIVAVGLTLVQALNQELVIPRIAPLLIRDQGDVGRRSLGAQRLPPTEDAQKRIFYAGSFDADLGTLTDVYIYERNDKGLATRRIYAPKGTWLGNAWHLDRAVQTRPADHETVPEIGPLTIESNLDPEMLRVKRFASFGQNLGWGQMREMQKMLDRAGADNENAQREREALQRIGIGRIATMFANLLTLVIAMSFFLTRVPKNMVLQSLKCAPVGITALVGGVLGASAPVPGMPPALSVFIPVMVLLPVAIAMVSRVRT
jgi:lipopolysaccharide export system permease protein